MPNVTLLLLSLCLISFCKCGNAFNTNNDPSGFLENKQGNESGKVGRKNVKEVADNERPVKLNMKQGLTMNQIISFYGLVKAPNELCRNHSVEFVRGLRSFQPWALKMFDSSSKMQSGILLGNLVEFGSFKQCLEIYESTHKGVIRGKHCMLKVIPDVNLIKKILTYRNISEKRFSKVYVFVKNAALEWSVCIPESCQAQDVLHHYESIIYNLGEGLNITVSLAEEDCVTVFDDKPFSKIELIVIIGFGLFITNIVVCTIIDLYSTREEVEDNKMVNIFSAIRNAKQIFARAKETELDCIHGIRFLSTCYVIIGHRYLMMMFFPVINSLKIMDWVLYYRSTVITGGTLCVDSFFMISGLLVSLGYFTQISKGRINWAMFYIYRYLRITVPLGVVLLYYIFLMHHFGSGPLWKDMLKTVQKPCKDFWWATLLHVQNYVHPYPLCMTQAWYLTCDMQYYFLSPIVLVPLSSLSTLGLINFVIVYILSMALSFYLAWINKYNGGVPVTNQLFSTEYFQRHYITPHTRAATYIIGLGLGYLLFKSKGVKMEISYAFLIIGWIVAIATMLASLVGCHIFHTEHHDYNRLESSIFLSCSRSAWAFGIVWMVWACVNGYGGPINSVLSSHIFRVLGRISYGMYLLHMQFQYMMSGASKTAGYFSDYSSLYASFGDLFVMVIIGFLFTICFESPLIKALSYLGKRDNEKKTYPVKIVMPKEKLFTVTQTHAIQ